MKSVSKSKNQRESRRPEYMLTDPLITAKEAAAERGQGVSTVEFHPEVTHLGA